MKKVNHVSNAPLLPETLDFEALLRAGIAQSQLLSSAEWTDYNEHDPGVTILEYLCFALTDLGYRTAHPIEDILSSSAASCHMRLDQQPLFTGNRILCTAPLTEDDYRKKIYELEPGIKNAWLKKMDEPDPMVRGLYKVSVQTFAPMRSQVGSQRETGPDQPRDPDDGTIVQRVRDGLMGLRNLGEDFAAITLIPKNEYVLAAEIEISAGTDPESTIAQLLFSVEMRLNPPPKVRDVDQQFQDNVPADQIFDGPELHLGTIDNDSLKPLRSDIRTETVLEAIMDVPGIREVSQLWIVSPDPTVTPDGRPDDLRDDPDAHVSVPTFSRTEESVQRIRVYVDGERQRVRSGYVLDHLRHCEQKRRWESTYAMWRMQDIAYARIPTGNAKRDLSRYRSIQHYFPDVYGIGDYGVGEHIIGFPEARPAKKDRDRRHGEARQLKAYLLFFEQLLADYLAQLDHTSRLFSFENLDHTYFSQPIVHPDGPNAEDGPPDIAPVLGDYDRYRKGLAALTAAQDPRLERRERALDHLLARFNERFDNERLRRLDSGKTETRDAFLQWRIDRKRDFLADYVNLSTNRGLGIDLTDPWETSTGCPPETFTRRPRETALQKRIRLKSGLGSPPLIIEHILLRDLDRPPGIGELIIDGDFWIEQTDPVLAIQFSYDGGKLHGVIRREGACTSWLNLRKRVLALAAVPSSYVLYPPGAYEVAMRLEDAGAVAIDIVEQFTSTTETRAVASHLVQLCAAAPPEAPPVWDLIRPVALPIDFFAHAVSIVLPATAQSSNRDQVREGFVESIIADAIPAHIAQNCYWLEPDEMAEFECDFIAWLGAQQAARTSQPSNMVLNSAAAGASRKLRDRLHILYCRDFLADRDRLRTTGMGQ